MWYNENMNRNIIIISGLSGAGKTSVSNVLEDLGYRCIDQFPVALLPQLLELIENDNTNSYEKVAISVPIIDLDHFFKYFDNLNIQTKILLLDANKDVLLNRYKFTRRIHPLLVSNVASTLEEAIDIEKAALIKYYNESYVIDTTELGTTDLKNEVEKILLIDKEVALTITFESFGYKRGIAKDADFVFDARFLENPFYYPELKNLTGNDQPVYDFVMKQAETKKYAAMIRLMLDHVIATYARDGKRHLTIAIGCTGGQHRSVTLANYLYSCYKGQYKCLKRHRDI